MPRHNALPQDKVDQIVELREEGRSVNYISKAVGCSRTTVQVYSNHVGREVRETGMSARRRCSLLLAWR